MPDKEQFIVEKTRLGLNPLILHKYNQSVVVGWQTCDGAYVLVPKSPGKIDVFTDPSGTLEIKSDVSREGLQEYIEKYPNLQVKLRSSL